MVDKNDMLFREVEEELRREQFARIWDRYGIYIIVAVVAIIAAIVGSQVWESRRIAQANAAGAEYEAATALVAAGKSEDAAKAFEAIAANGPKGYAALAALSQAGAYLKQDKRAEALVVFDKLAEDTTADRLLADFARLQAAALRLGEADFTEMENRLKPLTVDSSSWRLTARELLGTAAVKAGKLDEARTLLTPLLIEPGVSRAASERIDRLMAGLASAELSTAPEPAPAATAPAPEQSKDPAPAGTDAEKPAPAP